MDIERVYQDNFVIVYRYVLSLSGDSHIAEEITQETFFKALKKIDEFKGECKLSVWLCQIAKNTYITYLGKRKRQEPYNEALFETKVTQLGPETELVNKETMVKIHKTIHELAGPYKEVVMLRTFGELAFSDIASVFGKSESWARVTYHRGKLKIKEAMESEDNM